MFKNLVLCFSQVLSREELRRYLLPLVTQSLADMSDDHDTVARHTRHSRNSSLLNASISSSSESGYDGDQEDEGEMLCEEVMDDEEFFPEFKFQEEEGMINKQFGDVSFFCTDDFARASSTPSILRDSSSRELEESFQEDSLPMDIELEPVAINNQIDSVSGYCVPVPVTANESSDAVGYQWESTSRRKIRARQPLKSIENSNVDNASLPWKPYNKKAEHAWRTRRPRNMLS